MTITSLLLLLCLTAVSSSAKPIVAGDDVSYESLSMEYAPPHPHDESFEVEDIAPPENNNMIRTGAGSPPYYGTIFVDGDIISESQHRSSLQQIELHADQQCVRVFNRRTNSYEQIQAHVFDVAFTDTVLTQFWVRASDYDQQEATDEVYFYALHLGRVPQFLRRGVHVMTIQDGNHGWGGLQNRITIYAGKDYSYGASAGESRDIHAETMVHEATHAVIDPLVYGTQAWNAAVQNDPGYISTYARDYPDREDAAETLLLWLGIKLGTINGNDAAKTADQIPNRLSFFDGQGYSLFPLDSTDPVGEIDDGYQWERLSNYFYPCGVWEGGDKTVVYSASSPQPTPTPSASPPSNACEDDPSWRWKGKKTCKKYLSTKDPKKKAKRCGKNEVFRACPSHCDLRCRCENSTVKFAITWNGKKKKVRCGNNKKRCDNSKFSKNCPALCETCF